VGAEVTVFIDPQYSGEAVLERSGDRWFVPFRLILSAFAMFFGWGFLQAHS